MCGVAAMRESLFSVWLEWVSVGDASVSRTWKLVWASRMGLLSSFWMGMVQSHFLSGGLPWMTAQ